MPAGFDGRATEVQVVGDTAVDPEGARESVTLLAIDPSTFADAVRWDETFADEPLGRILDRLRATGGGATPAIAVGVPLERPTAVETGSGRAVPLAVEPVADVEAFPGMKRAKPTLFVDAAALAGEDVVGDRRELWVRGERTDVLVELQRAGVSFRERSGSTGCATATRTRSPSASSSAPRSRAAVMGPRLLVADEPVSHQNHARAEDVMAVVVALASAGTACLLATYDEVAVSAADRVVELRDGRVHGEHRPR